jgi:glycosyltransferase involved in cell wall biosynthesis
MGQPLVSVITPSYNQAQYLEDSIKSVLAQDYPSLEYLIADGGSTDGSIEIIRKYQSQLAWWVSEADEGQAAAINKGMAQAQGEIVAWLNSDDLYLPGAVKEAVAAFQEHPREKMVFGNAITIDAQGVPLKELVFPNWDLEDLVGFRIICQPAVFMRREVYQQVNGLDPRYHFMLDHHLWIRIASKGPILHMDSFWAAARHHEAAKNVSQAPAFGRETMEVLDWMQQQDDLGPIVKNHQRKVMAGAYRLNGRYLLDGDLFEPALKSYGQAFVNQPMYTARHWRRILYACLGLMGVKNLERLYSSFQEAQRPNLSSKIELRDWPGLRVDQ